MANPRFSALATILNTLSVSFSAEGSVVKQAASELAEAESLAQRVEELQHRLDVCCEAVKAGIKSGQEQAKRIGELEGALADIANMAHRSYDDPLTVKEMFERIESRALLAAKGSSDTCRFCDSGHKPIQGRHHVKDESVYGTYSHPCTAKGKGVEG
jgi:hypothetical protein